MSLPGEVGNGLRSIDWQAGLHRAVEADRGKQTHRSYSTKAIGNWEPGCPGKTMPCLELRKKCAHPQKGPPVVTSGVCWRVSTSKASFCCFQPHSIGCFEGFLFTKQTEFMKLLIHLVAWCFTTQAYITGKLLAAGGNCCCQIEMI